MSKNEIVVGGVYSNDGKVGVRVTRVSSPNAHFRTGLVYWVYAFWDREEAIPDLEYRDTVQRFGHWARRRLDIEEVEGEVPLS